MDILLLLADSYSPNIERKVKKLEYLFKWSNLQRFDVSERENRDNGWKKIIKGTIEENILELSFHILKQHISPSHEKSPGCRMEVFHSLLSDKWTGGQEIGFS